ncbi:SDR family NAD(P)-dependent oxidoreductase [Hymenobacter busanensis]|uniref:SDR family NAD(P)-dependent oxidoreductase n=1 Tax=Hymenobacter busanensis TaxID=2607656 RepID=A0A7L4ZUQ3_9BACT|nr:SDR family oxidoreductase [Hymenobacter busanensis]KAA9339330.1 SDR family NAD(P)-dependent oxidoreductase [Hymenobacter busanensis]QHJ06908.1 SDR family NAD(P)-dependent oxidoreductase [Hymenobacter busanensis]
MNLAGNTVLITGGASGIGLALAERFVQAGSDVILCGRRADKLQEAQQRLPGAHIRVCDVAQEADRAALLAWVQAEFPQVNVLLNNAGIQNRLHLPTDTEPWEVRRQEIAINLEAPIHLAMLFTPHLRQQPHAAIINITSGLSFAPGAFAPIYSATKAALHSFTLSLRHQLAPTGIRVLEIVPPAVNTDLGGPGLHTFGVPVDDFADAVMRRLELGEEEVGYGTSEEARLASRAELDARFKRMNQP